MNKIWYTNNMNNSAKCDWNKINYSKYVDFSAWDDWYDKQLGEIGICDECHEVIEKTQEEIQEEVEKRQEEVEKREKRRQEAKIRREQERAERQEIIDAIPESVKENFENIF